MTFRSYVLPSPRRPRDRSILKSTVTRSLVLPYICQTGVVRRGRRQIVTRDKGKKKKGATIGILPVPPGTSFSVHHFAVQR